MERTAVSISIDMARIGTSIRFLESRRQDALRIAEMLAGSSSEGSWSRSYAAATTLVREIESEIDSLDAAYEVDRKLYAQALRDEERKR